MKNILCFGDSLTWGYRPEDGTRYERHERWTGILQEELSDDFHIIEEGLNGRTTVFNDPFAPGKNGSKILPILLDSHAPLDLVVLFLGSNDLKAHIKGKAKYAALGCSRLILLIRSHTLYGIPQILLLSPPHISQPKNLMNIIFENAEEESLKFSPYYQSIAEFFVVHYLDTASIVRPSTKDGIHLDIQNNQILANQVANKIREILPLS